MKTLVEKSEDLIEKNIYAIGAKTVGKKLIELIPFVGSILTETMPTIWAKSKQSGFNDFLIGINKKLLADELSQKDIEKFKKKLEKTDNYQYLSTIIDSVFFSKNKTARILLGIITANYINKEAIDYEDLIIISALKDLLDEEFRVFIKFFKLNQLTQDYTQVEKIIVDKLINLSLFGRISEAGHFAPDSGQEILRFRITEVSNKLEEYLKTLIKDDSNEI